MIIEGIVAIAVFIWAWRAVAKGDRDRWKP